MLPAERERFTAVDKRCRDMMTRALKKLIAIEFWSDAKFLAKLQMSNPFLDLVSEGLLFGRPRGEARMG